MHLSATKTRKIREQLDNRRRTLLLRYHRALDRLDEELADHSPELVDTANEQWDAKLLDRMTDTDAVALSKLVAALRRLDGGTYGICTMCDGRIAAGRLAVLPEAERCASCAAIAERH